MARLGYPGSPESSPDALLSVSVSTTATEKRHDGDRCEYPRSGVESAGESRRERDGEAGGDERDTHEERKSPHGAHDASAYSRSMRRSAATARVSRSLVTSPPP